MYIVITEDGLVGSMKSVSSDDLSSANDGLLDIIDISNPEKPVTYYDGKWNILETLETVDSFDGIQSIHLIKKEYLTENTN